MNPLLSNSDDGNEFLNKNNNNLLDNNGGVTEVCDVPDEIANQKRHVMFTFRSNLFRKIK